ncbi:MAG: nucleoside triphosphate pyrophosphohydrolase [Nitrospirae bacterium GWD2_57_9]|nr:MAG: nucleoside triphosphate pyrophosphohydrolase [Nitrospirae bacterium GWD2_57_9]
MAQDNLKDLVDLMATLRGPRGCPWDRKQTTESLKPFLIEETYEVIDALDEGDPAKVREELGDLLFQIIFHAQLAAEKGEFTIKDVIATNVEKMTRRHPHVFGDAKAETAAEVLANWEEIKKKEKGQEQRKSILEGVPRSMPSLIRAHKLQEKAAKVGFDWSRLDEALPKLDEEIAEFKESLQTRDAARIEEELGDIFFMLVNLSRFLEVDPEEALRKTISKFIRRFRYIEESAADAGRSLKEMTLDEMEQLWQESKKKT